MHLRIVQLLFHLFIVNMSNLRSENTVNVCVKLSIEFFSSSGGMAREATVFYQRLAELVILKREESYSVIMGWLRCRLSFALLRSAIHCIRGSHSSFGRPVHEDDASLAVAEGELQLDYKLNFFHLLCVMYKCELNNIFKCQSINDLYTCTQLRMYVVTYVRIQLKS